MVHPSQQRLNYSTRRPSWTVTYKRGGRVRNFAIRPMIAGPAIGFFVLLLGGYVISTAYLIYRDDLVGAAVTHQVSMQYAYEERIAALRSELDRLTSRHLVQTEGVEQQLANLLDQQATIEQRQSALDGIVGRARTAGIAVSPAAEPADAQPLADAPTEDGPADSDADAPGPLGYMPTETPVAGDAITNLLLHPHANAKPSTQPENIRPLLSKVRASLDGTEANLSKTLDVLGLAAQSEADRLSAALAPIGVTGADDGAGDAEGGPFVPTTGLHFVEKTALLGHTLDDIDALRHAAAALPVGMPVRATRVSSRFGYRRDPFLNRPAFHAGLDLVAAAGSSVTATAPGTVISAGWSGGYGQMVEVKHADGVSTRYGHLSAILVSVGTKVTTGTPLGLVGSTGRSTGPHLHYETRRGGDAVDPTLYLAAGKALRGPS